MAKGARKGPGQKRKHRGAGLEKEIRLKEKAQKKTAGHRIWGPGRPEVSSKKEKEARESKKFGQ